MRRFCHPKLGLYITRSPLTMCLYFLPLSGIQTTNHAHWKQTPNQQHSSSLMSPRGNSLRCNTLPAYLGDCAERHNQRVVYNLRSMHTQTSSSICSDTPYKQARIVSIISTIPTHSESIIHLPVNACSVELACSDECQLLNEHLRNSQQVTMIKHNQESLNIRGLLPRMEAIII